MNLNLLRFISITVLSCCLMPAAYAKQGQFDSTFNSTGFAINGVRETDRCNAAALAPDGKIILAGEASFSSGLPLGAIIRYKANGTIDSSFGALGRAVISAGNSTTRFNAVAVRPDGRIIAVGEKNTNGSSSNWDIVVAQLKTNGSLDSNFGVNGIFTQAFGSFYEYGRSMALQPDGKILIGGTCNYYGSKMVPFVARVTANGIADNSFGTGGFSIVYNVNFGNSRGESIALGTDGRITLAGSATISSSERNILYRFDAAGNIDKSFSMAGEKVYDMGSSMEWGTDIQMLAGNRPLVMGQQADYPSITTLARFGAAGETDTSFGRPKGFIKQQLPENLFAAKLLVHPSGRYLIAGSTADPMSPGYTAGVFSVDTNGDWDSSWANGGLLHTRIGPGAVNTEISAILAQPDGKVIITGTTTVYGQDDFWVARLEGPEKASLSTGSNAATAGMLELSAYPNPFGGKSLSVSCKSIAGSALRFRLKDVTGREVASFTQGHGLGGTQTYKLELQQDLAPGTYLLQVNSDVASETLRVVKQ